MRLGKIKYKMEATGECSSKLKLPTLIPSKHLFLPMLNSPPFPSLSTTDLYACHFFCLEHSPPCSPLSQPQLEDDFSNYFYKFGACCNDQNTTYPFQQCDFLLLPLISMPSCYFRTSTHTNTLQRQPHILCLSQQPKRTPSLLLALWAAT